MAGVYKGLTVKIGADTTGLSSALNRIDSQTRGLKREMRSIDKALKLDPKNTELARQKMEAYQKEIASASDRLKTLKDAESQIGKEGMSSKAWDTLQRDIVATEANLNRLTSEYRAFTAEQAAASSGLGKVGAALTDVGERLEPIAGKMQTAGAVMSATITAPMVAAGTVAVKKAMDFETSLAKVSTLADESVVSMEEMGDGARNLAVDYGKSASEINEALYQAMSASVDTAGALGFVETATRLSKAGFTESATAVDVLTTAMNAYGLEADDAAHIADVLVNTQNLGKTTVDELAASMGNVIPTAAAYNVDLHNLAASYAVMTKQGINTANATTAINGMLTELADSGSTVNGVLQDMTGKTFGQLMTDGASLGDVIGMLSDAVGGNSEEFANLWSNVRASKGALAIANAGVDEFNGTLASMESASGTVDEALGKLGDTTGASLAKAKAAVDDAAISVGQVLLPYVEMAAGAVKDAADAFNSLSDEEKEQVVRTAAIAASIGPVLLLLSKAMTAIGTIGKGISTLAKGFATLDLATNGTAKGFKAAAKAGEDMAGKAMAASVAMGAAKAAAIGLAVAGVMVLVSAIKSYLDEQEKFRKATSGLTEASKGFASASDVAAIGLDSQSTSAEGATRRLGDYHRAALDAAEAGAELADSINDSLNQALVDSETAQAYADVIKDLAGNCDGSADKLGELQGAIDAYNELTGSSIQIVDDYSGRINESTVALDANTQAFKENAYAKAAGSAFEAAVQHQIEITNELEAQRRELAQAESDLANMRPRDGQSGMSFAADVNVAQAKVDELKGSIASLEDQQTAASKAVDVARESMGEYAAAAKEAEAAAKAAATTTDEYRAAFDRLGEGEGLLDEFAGCIGTTGDALAESLRQAGIGIEQLELVGKDNFDRLAEAAGYDFTAVAKAIAVVDSLGIDPKAVDVDSSGVVTAEGHIIDLNAMTIDGKKFTVGDDGTIQIAKDEIGDLDGMTIGGKTVRVYADTSDFWAQIEDLRSKNIYIPVVTNLAQQNAAGGLSPKDIRAIPRHADGGINGIVTRATLTNVGLVGEAGDEAVLHMRHAGGAIIPLSDRRHVRPFAQAVAAEMGAAGGATYDNRRIYQIGDITVPPGSAAAAALEALVTALDIEDRS